MHDGDLSELRLLVRLHYALAVLTALVPLVMLPVLKTGLELLAPAQAASPTVRSAALSNQDAEGRVWRAVLGKLAVGGVAALAAVCWVHAGVLGHIGRQISARRRWLLAMVFAALHLVNVPLGTALSLFTFVVLGRSGVQEAFGRPVADRARAPVLV